MLSEFQAEAFLGLPYPVFVYDRQSLAFLAANDAALARYGYPREHFLRMTLLDIRPSEDHKRFMDALDALDAAPTVDGPWRHMLANRETIFVETIGMSVCYEGKEARAVLIIDITTRVHSERRLEYLALHDGLTGLPNRLAVRDRLASMIDADAQHSVGVFFLAFSGLSTINETLGHQIGDEVLRRAAHRLQEAVQRENVLARFGDNEFVLLLSDVDDDELQSLAALVIRTFKRPFTFMGRTLHVSPSIGISVYPTDSALSDELIRRAQTAMYTAVSLQTGCEIFAPQMEAAVERRLQVENDLRAAIERGEFVLHVQPIFNARLDMVIAAEALIRWNHPSKGLLLPAEFMDVAEETGLIVPMGSFVIQDACRIAREWKDAGVNVPIAVNVSGRQLYDDDFVAGVSKALLDYALAPEYLEIELTESSVVKDMEHALETITLLREMGVRVAIDDFGTGYNSMVHLKRLPVHALKIDRTFINEMLDNQFDFAMVEAMIGLGRRLGLHIVAEGIETAAQAAAVVTLGAGAMQGFLMSRPIASDHFIEFYRDCSALKRKPG
ncbi:MAG TPA: EAL domain-containing protein [Candidatus Baltobacteraceae bacterium]|nr:EAL domain-containing protein [Candidatus Baltobacteraceae bacterium]